MTTRKVKTGVGRRGWVFSGIAIIVIIAGAGGFFVSRHAARDTGIEAQAERFVTLGLGYSKLNPEALDSYFGPAELEPVRTPTLDELKTGLVGLKADLANGKQSARANRLEARAASLLALIAVAQEPDEVSFTDEARMVYGMNIDAANEPELQVARARLDELLPGPEPLSERIMSFETGFVIPPDRRKAVFAKALEECRVRTASHWPLPANDNLELKWTGQVDAAWHRYFGMGKSVLQVNPQAVATVGSALNIACHEAYPGHHAQFLAMDAASPNGLAVEDRLVLATSPGQLLREGAAEYGTELAFPLAERINVFRDELFPLAGIDPERAEKYARVQENIRAVAAASTPILRDYLDGRTSLYDAGYALQTRALIASPRALLQFARENRAYVLGYALGKKRVRQCVESRANANGGGAKARWQVLRDIAARADISALQGQECTA